MPGNTKGGKGYKKQKKGDEDTLDAFYIERQDDQMAARVIRLLGNRNVLCYCNDNRLRICHICGKMKGRVWIEPGDMVLVSLRDFETQMTEKDDRRGDILAKYAPEHLGRLRREEGMNPVLFQKLETSEGLTLAEVGMDKTGLDFSKGGDDGFVFEDEGEEAAGGAAAPAPAAEKHVTKPRNTTVPVNVRLPPAPTRDDEIDIDAI